MAKEQKKELEYIVEANKVLANLNVLFVKLHNYHWFVTGEHFFGLHAKFEELYDECALHLDAVAERILTVNEKPLATLKEYLEIATIKEATGKENTAAMVKAVESDLQMMADEMLQVADLADDADDSLTEAMFEEMAESFKKHAWMLRAVMGK